MSFIDTVINKILGPATSCGHMTKDDEGNDTETPHTENDGVCIECCNEQA